VSEAAVAERARAVIATDLDRPAEQVRDDLRLADLGVDSLGRANLWVSLGSAFEVDLDEKVFDAETVGAWIDAVETAVAAKLAAHQAKPGR